MDSSAACPNCGAARLSDAIDCPTCGVVFAKYRGPRMQAAPTPEPVTHEAPARPPHAEPVVETGEGVWRRGRDLVVSRVATLPDRCVSCNAPAETRIKSKLSWHQSWVYVFVLVNVLVYALVALVVRKKAELEIPQCGRHARLRRWGFLGAWALLGLGCLAAFAAATMGTDGTLSAMPLVLFFGAVLASLLIGFTISRPVVARRIDDEFVWLGKCGRSFLSSLPEAPRGV